MCDERCKWTLLVVLSCNIIFQTTGATVSEYILSFENDLV